MKKTTTFCCAQCGGQVRPARGRGRTRPYRRDVVLPISDDFLLPTCSSCGETYESPALAAELDKAQSALFREQQAAHCRTLVGELRRWHGASVADIERACGKSTTYLSQIMNGHREPSLTLMRLLECFAAEPSLFARYTTASPHALVGRQKVRVRHYERTVSPKPPAQRVVGAAEGIAA
jgi:transcriptional regulator with XRE-family HTH domain